MRNHHMRLSRNQSYCGLQTSGRVILMMSEQRFVLRRAAFAFAMCTAILGLASVPAQARVFIGVGIPFFGPGYYPPPYYYPPPVYYPPPPVVYAPPQPQIYSQAPGASADGQMCYAGSYSCPMDHPSASGGSCYCLGNGGQRVWGRTN